MNHRTLILIVDDDPSIRELLIQVLQNKEYNCIQAANGKAALQLVEKERPAIALLDLNLGDMPGLHLMREIKALSPETECIVLTGHASQSSAIEAINLGAYSYILKPFDIDYLLATVRGSVDKFRSEQALKESEERFRNIVESSPMGMHIYELNQEDQLILTGANPAADQILGIDHSRLIGFLLGDAFPALMDTEVPDRYRRAALNGESWHTHQVAYKDDKISGVFEVHAFQTTPGSMAVFFVDVTERTQAEESVRQRAAQLALLNQVGSEIATLADLDSVLKRAVDLIHKNFGYYHIALYLVDREHEEVVLNTSAGSFQTLFPGEHRLKFDQGLIGWVVRNNESALANDVGKDDRYVNFSPEALRTQSELCLPIQIGEEVAGVIDLQSPQKNAFDDSDVIVMGTLANQIAVAIKNVHQHEALQRRLQESQALTNISQALNKTLDLDQVLQLIVDSARRVISHVERAVIHLMDDEKQVLVPIAVSSDFEMGKQFLTMRPGVGVAGQVMDQGISINIRDTENDPRFVPNQDEPQSYLRSLLVAPIQSGNRRIGTISVSSSKIRAFSNDDDNLLTLLGVQAALAIETSRLFEETRRSLRETDTLYRISNQIIASQEIDVDEILQWAVNMLWQKFGFYHVHVYLFDQESGLLTAQQGSGLIGMKLTEQAYQFTLEQGVVGYVAAVGDPFVTNNVHDVYFYAPNPLLPETSAELAVPLMARGHLLGVLDIHHKAPNEFSRDDLRLIQAVADQLAGVLDKAILYARLEDALQKEQAIRTQLIQTEKLAAMGRLVASVAHELNNPLQAIQNALYLIKMEDNLNAQTRGDLQVALDETTRMGNLIARLRDTYRPKIAEKFEKESLNTLVTEVEKLITTHLRHNNIDFELVPEPDLPLVSMSRDQIKQVILNLCLNAVESMPDGGRLTVRTAYDVDEGCVGLEVEDTGAGIQSEIIPHIFEPFYTTKEKGTGLGLFISYEILQNHGGAIDVESDGGCGTTFKFTLPLSLE